MGHLSGFSGSSSCSEYMSSVTVQKKIQSVSTTKLTVFNINAGGLRETHVHLSARWTSPSTSGIGCWCSYLWGCWDSSWCASGPWRRPPWDAAPPSLGGNTCGRCRQNISGFISADGLVRSGPTPACTCAAYLVLKNISVVSSVEGEWAPSCLHSHSISSVTWLGMMYPGEKGKENINAKKKKRGGK